MRLVWDQLERPGSAGRVWRASGRRYIIARNGRYDTSRTRVLCFSGAGFDDELRFAADAGEAVLIDLPMLYR